MSENLMIERGARALFPEYWEVTPTVLLEGGVRPATDDEIATMRLYACNQARKVIASLEDAPPEAMKFIWSYAPHFSDDDWSAMIREILK